MASDMEQGATVRRNRWSFLVWGGAAVLLSLPAIAMRFTSEVDWGPADFIIMGVLLALACGSYELVTRISSHWAYRAGAAAAIVVSFLTVWVNLAVGMVGDEGNPANLFFGLVIAVGALGAAAARFRPAGVARAMEAAAAAQVLMAAYASFVDDAPIAVLIALFALPWIVSAQLFRKAARDLQAGAGG